MAVYVTGGRVWLDGVEINDVCKFNIAEGWVECFATSPSNYSNVDSEIDEFLKSRMYGFVEFKEAE